MKVTCTMQNDGLNKTIQLTLDELINKIVVQNFFCILSLFYQWLSGISDF